VIKIDAGGRRPLKRPVSAIPDFPMFWALAGRLYTAAYGSDRPPAVN
jgi:hypothetical protein